MDVGNHSEWTIVPGESYRALNFSRARNCEIILVGSWSKCRMEEKRENIFWGCMYRFIYCLSVWPSFRVLSFYWVVFCVSRWLPDCDIMGVSWDQQSKEVVKGETFIFCFVQFSYTIEEGAPSFNLVILTFWS